MPRNLFMFHFRYMMIKHEEDKLNPRNSIRFTLLRNAVNRCESDGLNNVNASIVSVERLPLYVNISVAVLGSP